MVELVKKEKEGKVNELYQFVMEGMRVLCLEE
jgi:hypothetical protein